MNKKLTLQDYELLSAYLDDSCSPRERHILEDRLQVDPELKQALLEFKHTQRLLQALPVKRAPRNFTLKAAQVPARPQRFFAAPALNFVSLTAIVLLAIVFGGSQLLPGFLGQHTASRAAAPVTFAAAMADTTPESSPMIITWGQGADTNSMAAKGLGGGGGSANPGSYSLPEAVPATSPQVTAVPTEAAPLTMLSQAPQSTQSDDTSSLILGIPDRADQGKVISPTPTAAPVTSSHGLNLIWIEAGLGALAAVSALIAWLLRRAH